jgi:multiple sugar transport system ATP-binding protein
MNFFDVRVQGNMLHRDSFDVNLTDAEAQTLASYEGKTIVLGVRPEDIALGDDITVKVFSNENLGMNTLVHGHLMVGETQSDPITCKLRGWCDYQQDEIIRVAFQKRHFFDKENGNAIR